MTAALGPLACRSRSAIYHFFGSRPFFNSSIFEMISVLEKIGSLLLKSQTSLHFRE